MSGGKIAGIVILVVGVLLAIYGNFWLEENRGYIDTIDYMYLISGIVLAATGLIIAVMAKTKST